MPAAGHGGGGGTCLMFCPTYSMTISSAAMGSMANSPHSWIRLRPKRSFFLRNWGKGMGLLLDGS